MCREFRTVILSKFAKAILQSCPTWGGGGEILANLGLKGKLVDKQVGQDDQDYKMTQIAGNLALTKTDQDCQDCQDGSAKQLFQIPGTT